MPRYIDADEVKKAIEESWDGCLGAYDFHEITMNDLWVIDKVPNADVVDKERYVRVRENADILSDALSEYQSADMVEVVRCKDCKHREKNHYCLIWGQPYLCNDECFCSYGESRTDVKNEEVDIIKMRVKIENLE